MSRRRIFRRLVAKIDVMETVERIAADNPLAAARFTQAVRLTEEAVLGSPGMGTSCDYGDPALTGMRRHPVRGFRKYLVFYIPRDFGIEVVRVLHGARDLDALFGS